jgi:hypothetical protein
MCRGLGSAQAPAPNDNGDLWCDGSNGGAFLEPRTPERRLALADLESISPDHQQRIFLKPLDLEKARSASRLTTPCR